MSEAFNCIASSIFPLDSIVYLISWFWVFPSIHHYISCILLLSSIAYPARQFRHTVSCLLTHSTVLRVPRQFHRVSCLSTHSTKYPTVFIVYSACRLLPPGISPFSWCTLPNTPRWYTSWVPISSLVPVSTTDETRLKILKWANWSLALSAL